MNWCRHIVISFILQYNKASEISLSSDIEAIVSSIIYVLLLLYHVGGSISYQ